MQKTFSISKAANGFIVKVHEHEPSKEFVFNDAEEMGYFINSELAPKYALILNVNEIPSDKIICAIKITRETRQREGHSKDGLKECKDLVDGHVKEPVIVLESKGQVQIYANRYLNELNGNSSVVHQVVSVKEI